MVNYYKYIDHENIERYLITYDNETITLNDFNLSENYHADLLSLKVNYCQVFIKNLQISKNKIISGYTLSSLYEKDAIKICDYLNSICAYNRLNLI